MSDLKAKSDKEWKKELSPEAYRILREKGTEAPYSGEYEYNFDAGTYMCGACGAKLFASDTKFDAHCGWPSFYDALPDAVEFKRDDSHGMVRTEVTCANCDSHLGHVFDDGIYFNNPTNQRYCINSLSLKFDPDNSATKTSK